MLQALGRMRGPHHRRMSTFGDWLSRKLVKAKHPVPLAADRQKHFEVVFLHKNYLQGLRLGVAATTAETLAIQTAEDAYLLFWCKRQLGVFASPTEEASALAKLPRSSLSPSPLELFVHATCALASKNPDLIRTHHAHHFAIDPFASSPTHPLASSWRDLAMQIHSVTSSPTTIAADATATTVQPSSALTAREEWNRYVDEWRVKTKGRYSPSPTMDRVMNIIGQEHIKREFLHVYYKLKNGKKSLDHSSLHVCITGNRGSGTSLVAKLYQDLMTDQNLIPIETYGQKLVDQGHRNLTGHNCVILIEQADVLNEGSASGKSTLRAMTHDMDKMQDLAFILTGRQKQMTQLLGDHEALHDRLSMHWKLTDYDQHQLLDLFFLFLQKKSTTYSRGVEGGKTSQAAKIVARRLAAQPNNVHGVRKYVDLVLHRQALRLRGNVSSSVNLALTSEDMIGPNPLTALETSAAYQQLMSMIGLGRVKSELANMIQVTRENYQRELRGEPKVDLQLNRVFIGNPGTGKTSVAALFGTVLCELGILSKGEYHMCTASDLVGSTLGESEKKTNAMLSAAQGCVLAIDESYTLDAANGFTPTSGGSGDPYRKAVIDTLVEKVQPSSDADRVVLLLGYKEPMEAMFRNANPGFARRFDWSNPIVFDDFSEGELLQILNQHLERKKLKASMPALLEACHVLSKKRRLPNFGNAGDVHNVANAAIARYFARTRGTDPKLVPHFIEACDFHDTMAVRETIDTIFRPAMLGCDALLNRLHKLQRLIDSKRAKGLDFMRSIPFTFVFVGRPGVGRENMCCALASANPFPPFTPQDVLSAARAALKSKIGSLGSQKYQLSCGGWGKKKAERAAW
jgi:AAA+ superfamily predicted ATPase